MTAEGIEVREGSKPSTCPYCHDALASGAVWECPKCHTGHHAECVRGHGKCTVLGCGAIFGTRAAAIEVLPRPAPAGDTARPVRGVRPGSVRPAADEDTGVDRAVYVVIALMFLVTVLGAGFLLHGAQQGESRQRPVVAAPVDRFDELVGVALAELAHRERAGLSYAAERSNEELASLFRAVVMSGKDANGLEAALREALLRRAPTTQPGAIEAVVRTARRSQVDRFVMARLYDAEGSWRDAGTGTRFAVETTFGGVTKRETRSWREGAPLFVDLIEGWSTVRDLGTEEIRTPAGTFTCRHLAGSIRLNERDVPTEAWVQKGLPVAVRVKRTFVDEVETTELVAIERDR